MSNTATELKLVDLGKTRGTDRKPAVRKELQSQLDYIRQSKVDHIYSPAVNKIYDLAMSYVEDAEKHANNGGRAAWTMGLWDCPFIYALDIVPISFTELGRLGSSDALTIAEDYFQFPKETCSMVGALLGEWFLRRDTTVRELVVFNASCEPLNMGYELIAAEGYNVYRYESVNHPRSKDSARLEQQIRFLTEELEDLAIRLTGKPVDLGRLNAEIDRANRVLAKVREIFDLRRNNPLYIKSLATMFLLMGSSHYFGKPEEYEATLELLIEELKTAEFIPSPKGKIVPLAWIGGRGQEFGVYKTIDDCGGAILSWSTPNSWTHDLPKLDNPLASIATHILGKTGGHIIGSPVLRLKYLEDIIRSFDSKGILFYSYVGCSFAGIHQEIQRDHFQKLGIPSISLEGTFQVGPPSGQLLTRIRAFVEMLT
ncbi:MAG: 2-hydroxyacyl-CoA dehydratase [Chlorobiaceae bacterium]|jgi:benzoyl-CoA reductase/2-hydroxyglutaryl-CoA dehydratase subunit BcrC/BadD/HgdB|nr:2-hydroxyacyl-CoA dehydratase [Chlorobiaceae bacterium]